MATTTATAIANITDTTAESWGYKRKAYLVSLYIFNPGSSTATVYLYDGATSNLKFEGRVQAYDFLDGYYPNSLGHMEFKDRDNMKILFKTTKQPVFVHISYEEL
ncbi:hypothetical protein J7L00_04235 [Candidatus Bathyarchaeota archaeon]|nr:hypothetical protein [Candidatus Bathyarchaeota archaeon]